MNTYLEKVHKRKGGKKSETVNQHTPRKKFCGEYKENEGITGGKLGEK